MIAGTIGSTPVPKAIRAVAAATRTFGESSSIAFRITSSERDRNRAAPLQRLETAAARTVASRSRLDAIKAATRASSRSKARSALTAANRRPATGIEQLDQRGNGLRGRATFVGPSGRYCVVIPATRASAVAAAATGSSRRRLVRRVRRLPLVGLGEHREHRGDCLPSIGPELARATTGPGSGPRDPGCRAPR